MASAARLYSPEVLALATSLANWPLVADLPLTGSARSPACGSALTVGLALDAQGGIMRIGVRAQACAIGQAAAALFAAHAVGNDRAAIAATLTALDGWLTASGPQPDWPGLDAIAPARDFPGRHGAMRLPWRAALEALPTG